MNRIRQQVISGLGVARGVRSPESGVPHNKNDAGRRTLDSVFHRRGLVDALRDYGGHYKTSFGKVC